MAKWRVEVIIRGSLVVDATTFSKALEKASRFEGYDLEVQAGPDYEDHDLLTFADGHYREIALSPEMIIQGVANGQKPELAE